MTKAKLQPWIIGISGKMGDIVFRQSQSGEVIIAKRPDMSKVEWSPAQLAQRERFKQATEYAKAAMADPEVRTIYEKMAAKAKKRPRGMAISDFFKGNNLLAQK